MPTKLEVGYAKRDITPPIGAPLAGRPMLISRRTKVIRDRLFARALHIVFGSTRVTLLAADLLLVTRGLQREVARASNHDPETLLVVATHTHSGPGGYWKGKHLESFMGPYREETRAGLVERLAETARAAIASILPADLSATSVDLPGMSTNRREARGVVDPVFTVLRFDTHGALPVCLASFGAHPVVGLEREPFSVTADYPGEICRRLEELGFRSIFIQGACGGTSPAFFRYPLHMHLRRIGEAFETSIRAALAKTEHRIVSGMLIRELPFPVTASSSRVSPDGSLLLQILENCLPPLDRFLTKLAHQGATDNQQLSLTVVRLGSVALVGMPGEVGAALSRSIRKLFSHAGMDCQVIASLCNGYAGYFHRKSDYEHSRRVRLLGLYENAMTLAGRNAGDSVLSMLARDVESHAERDTAP